MKMQDINSKVKPKFQVEHQRKIYQSLEDKHTTIEDIDVDDYFNEDKMPGKTSFNMFVNEMQVGDLVCVFNNATSIKVN